MDELLELDAMLSVVYASNILKLYNGLIEEGGAYHVASMWTYTIIFHFIFLSSS